VEEIGRITKGKLAEVKNTTEKQEANPRRVNKRRRKKLKADKHQEFNAETPRITTVRAREVPRPTGNSRIVQGTYIQNGGWYEKGGCLCRLLVRSGTLSCQHFA
jgi:hypothetical protein